MGPTKLNKTMTLKKTREILKVKYFLFLILIVSGVFFVTDNVRAQEHMVGNPITCTDGTVYNCGYWTGQLGDWLCGIKKNPGSYDCGGSFSSFNHASACENNDVWLVENGCPDTANYNGKECILADSANIWNLTIKADTMTGVWDALDKVCVQCNGKDRAKLLAQYGTPSKRCYNYTQDGGLSTGAHWEEFVCANDLANKCDYACGADLQCNHYLDAVGVAVPGRTCDNCVFTGVSTCGNNALDAGEQCDPPFGGACPGLPCVNCLCPATECDEAACNCTCPAEIPCKNGSCEGGLVPCGRSCDDPCTKNCECAPCTLCHLFVLFKRIIDFITLYILFPIGVLMFVVGGVTFLTAAGDPGRITSGKKIITAAIIGLLIVFIAWLVVDTIIYFLVPAGSQFLDWSTIECSVQ